MIPSIEPSEVGFTGLAWLLVTYGYILYYASNLISEGSDLLLLVPSMASFVGGTVLPLLGAVPDGAILLFSGLGDIKTAQTTLSVGVGALAGSTIMLLTVPWALSVIAGRVELTGPYTSPNYLGKPKLRTVAPIDSLWHTGVALTSQTRNGACVMMISTIPYFLMQIPASIFEFEAPQSENGSGLPDQEYMRAKEHIFALSGFVICLVGFISYLYFQVRQSQKGADRLKRIAVMKRYVYEGFVSLSGVMGGAMKIASSSAVNLIESEDQRLLNGNHIPFEVRENLEEILREVFRKYDSNKNGTLEPAEFREVLHDLSEHASEGKIMAIFKRHDVNNDGTICFNEFVSAIWTVMCERMMAGNDIGIEKLASDMDVDGEDDAEEEEDQVPEGMAELSPEEQQKAIKKQAFLHLASGTVLVVLFSDPMVDVLQEIANRIGISPFYVSFVLAPLASNASEVIASQYYAAKKTRKTITVSLTALEGAASMNNTFCLSILLGLIYFRGLVWEYTAETIAIVLVEFCVGWLTRRKDVMTVGEACLIMSFFPISIALVALMEKIGFD